LAKSCAYYGVDFAIITNNKSAVSERLAALGGEIDTIEHVFDRETPEDASFYAAHFKLDLLRAFCAGTYGARVGLIDIDTILIRPIVLPTVSEYTLFVYDIADRVRFEIGDAGILRYLSVIGGPSADRAGWYGGEFISGGAPAFASLSCVVDAFWVAYRCHYRDFHHVGDEVIVTAALGHLRKEGMPLVDVGAAGLVARDGGLREPVTFRSLSERSPALVSATCLPTNHFWPNNRRGSSIRIAFSRTIGAMPRGSCGFAESSIPCSILSSIGKSMSGVLTNSSLATVEDAR
jgi:hypothetical protein